MGVYGVCGYVWMCMTLYGCLWMFMGVWMCMVVYGCLWVHGSAEEGQMPDMFWYVWMCNDVYDYLWVGVYGVG